MGQVKEIMKGHDVKSVKIKDGNKKLKVKFSKKSDDKYESKKHEMAQKHR